MEINKRLSKIRSNIEKNNITIMILGLGSVGNYLLDYLVSQEESGLHIVVVGRNYEKMEMDVNIIRIASAIRKQNRSKVTIVSDVDFNEISQIQSTIEEFNPDFIVNASRVYSGLKYGSISWNAIRAYGLWSPLAIKYIKNIMLAHETSNSHALVINTSYSDAVIPWLKSAGLPYPDLGSGNINHLIPRIQLAIAEELNIARAWEIDITYATSHFHDVVISKEGHTENIDQLIYASFEGREVEVDWNRIFQKCCISMPSNAKRNMMNASSNYEIIDAIISAVRNQNKVKIHSPGALGEVGGYPVVIDGEGGNLQIYLDESKFTLPQMKLHNARSIYQDGIEKIENGSLFFTDELCNKVKNTFGVSIEKEVKYTMSDEIANYIIENIIKKNN